MIQASPVLVIIGSTRARRICPAIADWVAGIGRAALKRPVALIDLRDWHLPMDDEPGVPAMGVYEGDHTSAWSEMIAGASGFVFVTPQYNWGYPAPLKNALDHLYKEWSGKPALIVTYGGHGGGKAGRQLRQVLKGLHMKPVRAMPGLRLSMDRIKANTGEIDPAAEFATSEKAIRRGFRQLSRALRPGLWNWWG